MSTDEKCEPSSLTLSDLLKLELTGKKVAMGRYDEILWKIRSGYMVVLSGTLGFFVVEETVLELSGTLLMIIIWFSFIALTVDVTFRRRQLRVVKAYNELADFAICKFPNNDVISDEEKKILFHISGENMEQNLTEEKLFCRSLFPSPFIYGGTSLIAYIVYEIQR